MKYSNLLNVLCSLFVFGGAGVTVHSQNLVPNGDFEQYSGCPDNISQIDSALYWINPTAPWGTPDYFNQCDQTAVAGVPWNNRGIQSAYSGGAYSGIAIARPESNPNFREYLEIPLSSPLTSEGAYYFEMYVCLAEFGRYSSDDIGVHFSDTLVSGVPYLFSLSPHIVNTPGNYPDTTNWMLFSGTYTATGTENYLLIGNFKDSANTSSIFVNSNSFADVAFIYIDDVLLTPITSITDDKAFTDVKIFPNPSSGQFQVKVNDSTGDILVINVLGDVITQQRFSQSEFSIALHGEKPGVYLVVIRSGEKVYREKVVIY